jgi:peptidoglycan/xylan/chitin deacetylase (PgdA/CDA1 family)
MAVIARRFLRALAVLITVVAVTACARLGEPGFPGATGTPTTSGTPAPTTTAGTSAAPAAPATSSPGFGAVPADLRGKDLEAIPTAQRVVALTFDAGSGAEGLASIMATLGSAHVPATFFLTGAWATANPGSVRALVASGYRIGNHTATHPYLTSLSDAAILDQLVRGRAQILAAGGSEPMPLFRFPYGDRDTRTIAAVNRAGYIAVRWTVDTLGWEGSGGGVTTQSIVNRVVAGARPGEIVLMHIGANPADGTTLDAAALPTVITALKALGYGFVTLDALTTRSGTVVPGCDVNPWQLAPVSVAHTVQVPPISTVTGIRAAQHSECKYDRIVIDLNTPIPSYELRYVSQVTADGSGRPVAVPGGGAAYLVLTLHPAQAHTAAGSIVPAVAALGYPMLKGYALSGDYEGYVSIALSLATITSVRVGELYGRVYVDVAY